MYERKMTKKEIPKEGWCPKLAKVQHPTRERQTTKEIIKNAKHFGFSIHEEIAGSQKKDKVH